MQTNPIIRACDSVNRPTSLRVTRSEDGTVRIFLGDSPEPVTTARWSDARGCVDAYGASLREDTWTAIDAVIRSLLR